MNETVVIAVFGGGSCTAREARVAHAFGRRVAEHGAVLLSGGRGGVMEAASRGAAKAGGLVLGILPSDSPESGAPNEHVCVPVFTGFGEGRNVIIVRTAHAACAIGGGFGTLSEIALASVLGKPLAVIGSWTVARRGVRSHSRRFRAPSPAADWLFEMACAAIRSRGNEVAAVARGGTVETSRGRRAARRR